MPNIHPSLFKSSRPSNVGCMMLISVLFLWLLAGVDGSSPHSPVRTVENADELVQIISGAGKQHARYTAILFGWAWDDGTKKWKETLERALTEVEMVRSTHGLGAIDVVYYPLETARSLAVVNFLGLQDFPVVQLYHHRLERRQPAPNVNGSQGAVQSFLPGKSYPRAYPTTKPVQPLEVAMWLLEHAPTRFVNPVDLTLQRYVTEYNKGPEAPAILGSGDVTLSQGIHVVFAPYGTGKKSSAPTTVARVSQTIVAAALFPSIQFQRCSEFDAQLLDRVVGPNDNIFVLKQVTDESSSSFIVIDAFPFTRWTQPSELVERLQRYQSPSAQEARRALEEKEHQRRRALVLRSALKKPFVEITSWAQYERSIILRRAFSVIAVTMGDDEAFAEFARNVIAAEPRVPVHIYRIDGKANPKVARFFHAGASKDAVLVTMLPVQYQDSYRYAIRSTAVRSWNSLDPVSYALKIFTNEGLRMFEQPSPSIFTSSASEDGDDEIDVDREENDSALNDVDDEERYTLQQTKKDEDDEVEFVLTAADLERSTGERTATAKKKAGGTSKPKAQPKQTTQAAAEKEKQMREELEEKKRKKQERIQEKERLAAKEREAAKRETQRKLEKQKQREEKKKATNKTSGTKKSSEGKGSAKQTSPHAKKSKPNPSNRKKDEL